MWITQSAPNIQEVLVVHGDAPLTELGRLRLARCVVDENWPLARAAERFQVAVGTAQRWAGRYRARASACRLVTLAVDRVPCSSLRTRSTETWFARLEWPLSASTRAGHVHGRSRPR